MDNIEKSDLRQMCKDGENFEYTKERVLCCDATIKRYMKIFSPSSQNNRYIKCSAASVCDVDDCDGTDCD